MARPMDRIGYFVAVETRLAGIALKDCYPETETDSNYTHIPVVAAVVDSTMFKLI